MKTIQTVERYFPEHCGGIQIHLSELLPVLQTYGVESTIAASQDKKTDAQYIYSGIQVYRYPIRSNPSPEPNHGGVPHEGFEQFAQWLAAQQADIYHQHQWTPKCGLAHLRLAKELGMKTVVSVHLPQPICQRQTLMFNGETECDGKIDVERCSRCCGVSACIPAPLVQGLGLMPMPLTHIAGKVINRLGRAPEPTKTAARFLRPPASIPSYVAARRRGLEEMNRYADRIVVMSQWVLEAIAINGIPREKLVLLKHGIPKALFEKKVTRTQLDKKKLRVVFLGRWAVHKGIHILVEAIKQLPNDIPLELVIHGIPQDIAYQKEIEHRIGDDPRIIVASELGRVDIPQTFVNFDLLAIPSQWLEIGPLVLLEAHALGLPVIGSDLGGIAEKIRHGLDGLLLPPLDVTAWAETLSQLAHNPAWVDQLRAGIRPVRTIEQEAQDSLTLYNSLLKQS